MPSELPDAEPSESRRELKRRLAAALHKIAQLEAIFTQMKQRLKSARGVRDTWVVSTLFPGQPEVQRRALDALFAARESFKELRRVDIATRGPDVARRESPDLAEGVED